MANRNPEQQGKNVDGRPEVVKKSSAMSRQPISIENKLDTPPLATDSPKKATVLSLFENPKVNEFIKHMGLGGKIELLDTLLDSGALEATATQRNRVKQLRLIKMAIASVKSDIAEDRTWTAWFERVAKHGGNPVEAAFAKKGDKSLAAIKITNMEKSLEDCAIELFKNPNATLDSLLGQDVKDLLASRGAKEHPKYWREFVGFVDKNGRIRDVDKHGGLTNQAIEMVNFLFEQRDYEGVRMLIEDVVFQKEFANERKKLDIEEAKVIADRTKHDKEDAEARARVAQEMAVGLPDDLHGSEAEPVKEHPKTFRDKAEDAVDSAVSDEMISSWRNKIIAENPTLNPLDVGKKVMEYRDMLISYQETRLKNEAIFKKTGNNPFGITNLRELRILKQYRNGLDTHDEWFTFGQQSKDFLFDQLVVNAPLIIVSGIGAAKFVHGLGTAAKFAISRNAAISSFTGLSVVRGAAVATSVATAGRARDVLMLGRGLSLLAEGAAFNVLHTGLQGPEHLIDRDLPTWGKEIVITTLTLGAFKLGGVSGRKFSNMLSSNIKFFDDPVAKTITNFLSTGSTEVGVMLALGTLESMYVNGKLPDTPFVEQLITALVAVGSLRIVGGVAHIGGQSFKIGAVKAYEKASDVSAKRFKAYEAGVAAKAESARVTDAEAKANRLRLINGLSGKQNISPDEATNLARRSNMAEKELDTMLGVLRARKLGWKDAALIVLSVGAKAHEAMQPTPALPVKATSEIRALELSKDSRFKVVEGNEVYDIPGGGAIVVPLRGDHGTSSEARTVSPRRHAELAKKSQEGINADLTKLGVPKAVTDSLIGEYNQVPDELKKYTRMFVTVSGEMITPYMSIDMEGATNELLKLAGLTKDDVMKKVSKQMGMDMPKSFRADASWGFIILLSGIAGGFVLNKLSKWGILGLAKSATGGALSHHRENLSKEEAFLASLPTEVTMVEGLLGKLVEVSPAARANPGEVQQADGKALSNNLEVGTKHAIEEAYRTAQEFARIIAVDRDLISNAKERANRQDLFTLIFKLSSIDAIIKDKLLSPNDRTALLAKRARLLSDFEAFTFKISGSKDLDAVIKSLRGRINIGGMSAQSIEAALVDVASNLGRLLPKQRLALIGATRSFYEHAVREAGRAASDKLTESASQTAVIHNAKIDAIAAADNVKTEAIKAADKAKTEAIAAAEKVATEVIAAADNAINEAAPKRNDANSKRSIADIASREAAELRDAHENLVELKVAAQSRTVGQRNEELRDISERSVKLEQDLLEATSKNASAEVVVAEAIENVKKVSKKSDIIKARANQSLAEANALKNAAERSIVTIERSLEALSVEKANVEMPLTEHTSRVNASAIKLRDLALKAERSEAAAKKAEAEAETIETLVKDSAKVKTAAEKTKTEAIEAAEKIEATAIEAANEIEANAITEANKPYVENLDESSSESAAQRELRHMQVVDVYEGLLRATGRSQTDIDAMRNLILTTTPTPAPADIKGPMRTLFDAIVDKKRNALAKPWKRNTVKVALAIAAWLAFANLPAIASSVTEIFKSDDAEGEDGDTPSEEGGTTPSSDPIGEQSGANQLP